MLSILHPFAAHCCARVSRLRATRASALGVGILCAFVLLSPPAAQGATTMRVVPPATTPGVDDVFDLRLEIDTTVQVDGAAAFLDFEASVLQVLGVTAGSGLPTVLQSNVDNFAGTVSFVAGALSTRPSGVFTFATIRCRARAASASTAVTFHTVAPRQSDVSASGASQQPQLVNADFAIQAASAPSVLALSAPAAVALGASFDVPIEVQSGNRPVDGAAAYLGFDRTVVQVVSVAPGTALPAAIQNRYDNAAGTLDFAAGSFDATPSGTFVLATVRFRAVGLGTASLQFQQDAPRVSALTFGGRALNLTLVNDQVTVAAPQATVSMALDPVSVAVAGGESFEMKVQVRAGSQAVDGAAAYLSFDPTQLQVLSVTPGSALPTTITNASDNGSGHIDFAAGAFSDLPSGTFDLAVVRFRTVVQGQTVPVEFSVTAPRKTDATFAGQSVLDDSDGASVVIGAATAGIALRVIAGAAQPALGDELDLIVQVQAGIQPVDGAAAYIDYDPAVLSVLSVNPGSDLGTVIQNDLDTIAGRIAIAAGELSAFPSGTFELARIRVRALQLGTTPVTLSALSPRVSDVTFAGASMLTQRESLNLTIGNTGVALVLVPERPLVAATEEFNVAVEVHTAGKAVDGAAAYLNFDPARLQAVSVTPGTHLSQTLINRIDNATGRVDVAAGTFGAFPSTSFQLATVRFRAVSAGAPATIALASSAPRSSDVTFGGLSILSTLTNTDVQIGAGNVVLAAVLDPPPPVAGQSVFVTIEVRAGSLSIDSAAAYVDYDPLALRVLQVTPGTALGSILRNVNDGTLGHLDFAAGTLGSQVGGTFTLARIEFLSLRAGQTSVLISTALARRSDAVAAGQSVLGGAFGVVFSAAVPPCALDLDMSNSTLEADTDAYFIYRYLVGLPPVPSAMRQQNPQLPSDATIAAAITDLGLDLDLDGDGAVRASTDAVYLQRLISGITPVVPAAFGGPSDASVIGAVLSSCCLPELGCGVVPTRALVAGPTPTPPRACVGDCDANREVRVHELVSGVAIALEQAELAMCAPADRDHDRDVSVDELVTAVNAALHGCS